MHTAMSHNGDGSCLSLHLCLANKTLFICVSVFIFLLVKVVPLSNRQRGMLVFVELHYGVSEDGQQQNGKHDVHFVLQADEGAVGKGNDETQ